MEITMDFLKEYFSLVIFGICLCINYIIRKMENVDNKHIPLILGVIGVALAFAMHWGEIKVDTILIGLFSGLAAYAAHQAFKTYIGDKE